VATRRKAKKKAEREGEEQKPVIEAGRWKWSRPLLM